MTVFSRTLSTSVAAMTLLAAATLPAIAQDATSELDRLEADSRAAIATYQAALSETFVDTSDATSDLSILSNVLPEGFAVTWDTADVNGGTGATVYGNLDISYTTLTGTMGLKFDTVAIWGLDEEFLLARLGGSQLNETASLATRIDASGMAAYGVAETIDGLIDMWIPEGVQEDIGGFGMPVFEMTTDRIVIDNLKLGAFAYAPMTQEQLSGLDEDGEFGDALPTIQSVQKVTAALAAIGYDSSVSVGNNSTIQMIIPGEDTTFKFASDLTVTTDYMGFDIGASVGVSPISSVITSYSANEDEPNLANFTGNFTMDQTDLAEFNVIEGLKMNGLVRMFTTASLPEMSATDIFSLGQIANFNGRSELNGTPIATYDANRIAAPSFTWFLPNALEIEVDNGTYDIVAIGNFVEGILDSAEDAMIEEDPDLYVQVVEGLEHTMALLPETGLEKLNFDFDGRLTWDSETGATQIAYNWFAPTFGDETFILDGKLPTYEQVQTLEGLEGEDFTDALGAMFITSASFDSLTWEQTDKGGYDKLMSFATGLAKNYPEEEWGAMLSNMDPISMRTLGALGIRMAKTELPADVPAEVGPWIDTLANYLQTPGGSIKIEIKPEQPITGLMVGMMAMSEDPSFIIDQLGISVSETPEASE